ncbi:MAG: thymidine phosphorylase [Bacilli bacterium]
MNIIDIIDKKKKKNFLTENEIKYFVDEYVNNNICDYQMSALLMAICINGLNDKELQSLTKAYINSGDTIDFNGQFKHIADKHSTGGVGDKTSLIIGPIVASCGVTMAKMSGRGLGHTGGTVDKLESINGFRTSLLDNEFIEIVKKNNFSIIGQSKDLVVADKKIYALRDVTGTVDSIPLIAASIMSKKIASGSDTIVLDVKFGSGAILPTYDMSVELAKTMVNIGKGYGKKTVAIISDMNQPLGYSIGNKLEIIEVIKFLKGEHSDDLYTLVLSICIYIISSCLDISKSEAEILITSNLNNGKALSHFKNFVHLQGGDYFSIESDYEFVDVKNVFEIKAPTSGYIHDIDALKIATIARDLGAGRIVKEDKIDFNVGIVLENKVNDYVKIGDVIAKVYANDKGFKNIVEKMHSCFNISDNKNSEIKMIYDEIY